MKSVCLVIIVLFFLVLAVRGYFTENEAVEKRRTAYLFAMHLKREVTLFKSPMSEIIASFKSEEFDGVSPEALPEKLESLSSGCSAGKLVGEIMSATSEEATERCERLCASLSEALEKEKEKSKSRKAAKVAFPLFLCAVILIVFI